MQVRPATVPCTSVSSMRIRREGTQISVMSFKEVQSNQDVSNKLRSVSPVPFNSLFFSSLYLKGKEL